MFKKRNKLLLICLLLISILSCNTPVYAAYVPLGNIGLSSSEINNADGLERPLYDLVPATGVYISSVFLTVTCTSWNVKIFIYDNGTLVKEGSVFSGTTGTIAWTNQSGSSHIYVTYKHASSGAVGSFQVQPSSYYTISVDIAEQGALIEARNAANTAATNATSAMNAANAAIIAASNAQTAANTAASNASTAATNAANANTNAGTAASRAQTTINQTMYNGAYGGSSENVADIAGYMKNQQLPGISTQIDNLNTTINNFTGADKTAPTVKVKTLSGALATSGNSVQAIVTITDSNDSTFTYSINGGSYFSVPGNKIISLPVSTFGPNAITVNVKDAVGNIGSDTIIIRKL
ncbi:MAG: hypothetical protein A4E53_01333 [Pelotomaculum sp. PtaB.Bin104]|nr:MAG: hypothetical protein A4E53_01333 [Pelotomaculum sp. PtaB.Bin104]